MQCELGLRSSSDGLNPRVRIEAATYNRSFLWTMQRTLPYKDSIPDLSTDISTRYSHGWAEAAGYFPPYSLLTRQLGPYGAEFVHSLEPR